VVQPWYEQEVQGFRHVCVATMFFLSSLDFPSFFLPSPFPVHKQVGTQHFSITHLSWRNALQAEVNQVSVHHWPDLHPTHVLTRVEKLGLAQREVSSDTARCCELHHQNTLQM
jgi:hypothetical protein